jgi:dihydroorotate dehydrogenase (fumarate)
MADLSTQYLGFKLATPLVASSSPLCKDALNIRRMAEAGIGAVVLHSLFEEQIELESDHLDRMLSSGVETADALTYFPNMGGYNIGPDGYVEHVHRVKAIAGIPVIASLNGSSLGGWLRYAKLIEQAGADALELNLYDIPSDPEMPGSILEQRYCDVVADIRSQINIPLAVKIGPYFSSLPDMARRLDDSGASALVIFNRFYQPDFDLESLDVVPSLELSTRNELLLRLHWAAILYGNIRADIAITGGVHQAVDIVKCMVAGARVAMTTSALLLNGIGHAKKLVSELQQWLEEHEYESISQMQGSMSARKVMNPSAFERGNYMRVLGSYTQDRAVTG